MTAAITYLMLKFFMMDWKWGANDVAEGVDYPQTSARFRTRNMTFRLEMLTLIVRAMLAYSSKVSNNTLTPPDRSERAAATNGSVW